MEIEEGSGENATIMTIAEVALRDNTTIYDTVGIGQIYFTSLYWSFTMLMKSPPPMIGPDTWFEKFFCCWMVILGLFVTTQLVAVVTQMVLSFDKANSAFRDRQQEYIRFASSRSLPGELRRKLFKYSLHEWSVNQGYDPLELIKQQRLPTALSNSMLCAMYDDITEQSAFLRVMEAPVLHVVLRSTRGDRTSCGGPSASRRMGPLARSAPRVRADGWWGEAAQGDSLTWRLTSLPGT